jgi:hypothetical protein
MKRRTHNPLPSICDIGFARVFSQGTAARVARHLVLAALCVPALLPAQPPGGRGGPPPTGQAGAVIDITGYWVTQVNEDWRWRMVTPPKGDFASIPLNPEGTRVGNLWDPAKDEAEGNQCKAYGAAGLMRQPTRLHITWADGMTLKIESDAGQQTRLLHFGVWKAPGGEATWQGDSVASWLKQTQARGFAPPLGAARAGGGGALKVVTTHMKPGYYRKNGVPYSGNAVLTEFIDRVEFAGTPFLIVSTAVDDPQYLQDTFLTSEQFKHEADGSKWNPQPCKTK